MKKLIKPKIVPIGLKDTGDLLDGAFLGLIATLQEIPICVKTGYATVDYFDLDLEVPDADIPIWEYITKIILTEGKGYEVHTGFRYGISNGNLVLAPFLRLFGTNMVTAADALRKAIYSALAKKGK